MSETPRKPKLLASTPHMAPVMGARVKWGGNKHEGVVVDVGLGSYSVVVAINTDGITRELRTDWRHLEILALPAANT